MATKPISVFGAVDNLSQNARMRDSLLSPEQRANMDTMPFMKPSTSASEASLAVKLRSQTAMILARSSSRPCSLLSAEISPPRDFKYALNSSACSSYVISMKTGQVADGDDLGQVILQ